VVFILAFFFLAISTFAAADKGEVF